MKKEEEKVKQKGGPYRFTTLGIRQVSVSHKVGIRPNSFVLQLIMQYQRNPPSLFTRNTVPSDTVSVVSMGIVFALVYMWRQSLVASIVMHCLQDFIGIVLLPLLGKR